LSGDNADGKAGEWFMWQEFKTFIARGNVLDLAVAVVIGAAFTAIVTSLTDDLINPILGVLTGGVDFSNHFIPLSSKVTADSLAEARKQGAVFAYGSFINSVIKFLIIAWVVFLLVKVLNRLMPKKEEAPKGPSDEVLLLTQIRDELRNKP
jgi:large conductance mechanosensitive channel